VIYLHKLLPLLLSPIVVVLALVLLGAWRRSRAILIIAALLLWTLSTPVIANALLRMVEGKRVRLTASEMPQAAAVVVLSGMLQHVQGSNALVPAGCCLGRARSGRKVRSCARSRSKRVYPPSASCSRRQR
jgi:cytochrome c biogenesis factor